jgi:phosphoribosylformimino-5-aminoimidazole carboxamide ribotide isomerase
MSSKTKLEIDFGGGIKTENDLQKAFENGASKLNIGSLAIENQSLFISWLNKYGKDKIMLSADVRNEKITINGWQEDSGIDIISLIRNYKEKGLENVVCTDVSKDGTLQGPSIYLYNKILNNFPEIKLIASGGISCISDIDKLNQIKVFGVIIGKAIYENRIQLCELKKYAD